MAPFIITVILAIIETVLISLLIPLEDSKTAKAVDTVLLVVVWVLVIVAWFMAG